VQFCAILCFKGIQLKQNDTKLNKMKHFETILTPNGQNSFENKVKTYNEIDEIGRITLNDIK
jgi:hypothetical protein